MPPHSRLLRWPGWTLGILLALFPAMRAAATEAAVTVFLVRHAEKESEIGDSPLSEVGKRRADLLAATLRSAAITHVFSSQYRRARETAQPCAAEHGVDVEVIPAQEPEELVVELRQLPPGSVALVVGHSNTVPLIAAQLGAPVGADIPEEEFDRLYVITRGKKSATSVLLHYGDRAPAASD